MIQVTDILNEVISGLSLPVRIYEVDAEGSTYIMYVNKTWYLNTNRKFVVDGVTYTVVSFVQDYSVTVTGSSSPTAFTSFTLPAPTFGHGKYKAQVRELARKNDTQIPMPFVWMFELATREQLTAERSAIESKGEVRLFWLNTAKNDFTTSQHYLEVIKPLSSVIDYFITILKNHKDVGVIENIKQINHAKFTTGGTGTTAAEEKEVFARYWSGVEMTFDLPINKRGCVPRTIPVIYLESYSDGYSDGYAT